MKMTRLRGWRGSVPLVVLFSVLLPSGASTNAQSAKLAAAESAILSRVQKSGAEVAIAFRTLDGKDEWLYRADDVFHAASTMKIPVMIELFHQIREGKHHLDDSVPVRNLFRSIVDGSPYRLDPAGRLRR